MKEMTREEHGGVFFFLK